MSGKIIIRDVAHSAILVDACIEYCIASNGLLQSLTPSTQNGAHRNPEGSRNMPVSKSGYVAMTQILRYEVTLLGNAGVTKMGRSQRMMERSLLVLSVLKLYRDQPRVESWHDRTTTNAFA
jgi:hypothetical protein